MKIISQFKDYYDYVAHLFGGGDDKIVYNRKRIGEYDQSNSFAITRPLKVPFSKAISFNIPFRLKDVNAWGSFNGFTWLIVCGRPYPLVRLDGSPYGTFSRDDKWEIFDEVKHADMVVSEKSFYMSQDHYTKVGVELPVLVELSKVVGHPVFVVDSFGGRNSDVVVNGECPNLGQLGLAAQYPAEQIYQDLAYFIVNKMKDSPDLAPASPVTDKEKIVQHGFDVRKSFRHRT